MYSPSGPVYVSDPKRRTLVAFVFLAVLSLLFGYAGYLAFVSSPSNIGNYSYAFIFPVFAILAGYGYIKATRVEFYNDFARILGRRGEPSKDYHYPDFDLGPLISSGGGYSFRIYPKGSKRALCSVRNVRLETADTTLYSFIQGRSTGVAPNSTSSFIPKGIESKSFLKKHPFLVAALIVAVLMIAGPYYFWNISGPQGTPLIDVEAGIGFFFGGVVILLALNIGRNYQLRKGTDR